MRGDTQKVVERIDWLLNQTAYFHGFDGDPPVIPFTHNKGGCPLWVIAGENAAGKSFFRRLISEALRDEIDEFMCLSMQGRTGCNFNSGAITKMIYGDESRSATSVNSAKLFMMAISSARGRDEDHKMAIFWDEADSGMSDNSAAGAGQFISKQMINLPQSVSAVFIITHSRHLLRQVIDLDPHFICLGDALEDSLEDWVEREVVPTSFDDLEERSNKRRQGIQDILNYNKDNP